MMGGNSTGSPTREALRRSFEVAVPLDQAWSYLADVRRWPSWAPHIRAVQVDPDGPLGPSSAGKLHLQGGMRATFRMSRWEPLQRWTWVGRAGGLTVHYDHRFEPLDAETTRMIWTVSLSGMGSRIARNAFARRYGRNVDRAIPNLQAAMASPSERS